MKKNTNFRRVFILMITAFLWVSSFNGFVFAGELPTETELDERVVEETQVEDDQIIGSDTETQPALEGDPVVESDIILDDNIETSTETEPEVETEAEVETDAPTKVVPQFEDDKDIATQDVTRGNVEIGDFTVSLVNTKAYTSQELTVKVALKIENVTPGYDLSGSMIKIKVPKKHLDSLKAGDVPGSTYVIADDGDLRVITYTFTDLSTSAFDFSVLLKTENYHTPDNFVVPVTAELITPDGNIFNSNKLDIKHHTAELNDNNFRINNVANDNALHFGGLQDDNNSTYISETGAFPLVYIYSFKTENLASGGEYEGSRVYSKREVTINLPTYTDYAGVERVALIDEIKTPGWILSSDGKSATYIEDFPLETTSRRTYNSYDGQAVLALKFPGAKADEKVQFKQTLSVKFIPQDATDYELANIPIVTFPEKTIRLTTKVKSPQLSKNQPRTMIDQLSAKQKEVSWFTYFRNTDLNLPMTDMVLEDYGLDPLMKFVRLRFTTSPTDFINLNGQPGKVTIVASTPNDDVTIAENIDPIVDKNFDIPENTTSVKISAVEGSIIKPGGTFRVYFDTLLKDPAGTTYKAGETEKFVNKARASGNLYESDLDLAIPLPNSNIMQNQLFLPYDPGVYIEKKSSLAQALPGDKIEFTSKIHSTINTRIFEPDALENPVILDLLPPGMVFAESQPNTHITYKDPVNEGVFNDTPEIINNYNDTGRTAIIWRGIRPLAGSGELEFATLRFNAMTNLDMYDGENTNEIFLGWSNNNTALTDPQQIGIFDGLVPDTFGISGSGKVLTRSTAQFIFSPPAMLRPRKFVQGDLNSNPVIGHGQANIGGTATFTLEEDNRTTNNITDLQVMDVLPRKGIAYSEYDLYLSAAATAPESYDVGYATTEPEISAAWLRNDANWGSLPTDLKTVTAIRFKLKSGSELASNEKHSFTVPVDVPQDATLTSGLQANNRMYTNLTGSDSLLISNAYLDLYTYNVKGRVFNDLNGDGIYQDNETTLEGITVRLLNADGTPATRSEITTVTDSQGAYELISRQPGGFKVAFDIPENFDLTIIPDGAIGNVNANHASKEEDLVVTDTFNLTFAPGSSTVRNAGVYSNNISLTATKVWANIPDGTTVFPKATISLYQDDVAYGNPIELTATGNGEQEAKWENLPKFAEDGSEFVYTVKETALSNGYARTVSEDGLTITNTYDGITDNTDPDNPITAETTLTATKVWKRVEEDTDPLPEGVNLQLIREQDQIDLGQKKATKDAEWKVTWEDLLAYAPDGSSYIYTVKEPVVPNGYKLTNEGNLDNGYTVTNTYYGNFENGKSFSFFLRMNKEYFGADGEYLGPTGKPEAELSLFYSDGEPVLYPIKPIVIKTNHQQSFSSLKFYGTDGEIIEYVMKETGVPNGYEFVEITSELSEGAYPSGTPIKYLDLTAINRYTGGEAQTVTATKVWANIPDDATSFPKATISLYQNGKAYGNPIELTATGNGEQEAKWENLPKFAEDGSEFVYKVKETALSNGYARTVSEDGLTITNTYDGITDNTDPDNPITAETTLTATKVWKRVEEDTDPLPEGVNLQLIREQDQIDLGQKKATKDAEWKVTWEDLLAYAPDGSSYIYTVKEPVVPNGYELTEEGNLDNGYTVTNTYYGNFENGKSFNFFLRMNKEYFDTDGNNLPTVNKPEAELSLFLPDGNPALWIGEPIVINTNHQESFSSLNLYGTDGEIIEYVMKETGVPNGYEFVEITSELSEGAYPSGTPIKYLDLTAINRYTGGEAQTVTATKVWANIPDDATSFPKATISLYQNGKAYGTAIELTATGNGEQEVKWVNLPQFAEDGSEFVYTVKETALSNGYARTVSEDGLTITNTYDGVTDNTDPDNPVTTTAELTATKVWANIPEGITVFPKATITLYQSGVAHGEIELTAENNGEQEVKWENLSKFAADGTEFVYTVKETKIPDQYDMTVSEDGLIITNKYNDTQETDPTTTPPTETVEVTSPTTTKEATGAPRTGELGAQFIVLATVLLALAAILFVVQMKLRKNRFSSK